MVGVVGQVPPMKICSIEGCSGESRGRNLCTKHYQRWNKHGDPFYENPRSKPRTCAFDKCNKPHAAKGWCTTHYARWRIHGDASYVGDSWDNKRQTDREYFESRVVKSDGCWSFPLRPNGGGYLATTRKGKTLPIHRLAYRLYVAEIPDGHAVHHKCSNRVCCNPNHLQAVSPQDNIAEMLERRAYIKQIKQLEREVRKWKKAYTELTSRQ